MFPASVSQFLALSPWFADTILALQDIVGILPLVNDVGGSSTRLGFAAGGSNPRPASAPAAPVAENGNCTAIVHLQIHRGPDGGKNLLCAPHGTRPADPRPTTWIIHDHAGASERIQVNTGKCFKPSVQATRSLGDMFVGRPDASLWCWRKQTGVCGSRDATPSGIPLRIKKPSLASAP